MLALCKKGSPRIAFPTRLPTVGLLLLPIQSQLDPKEPQGCQKVLPQLRVQLSDLKRTFSL
jgi:hypothetical protein